MNINRLSYGSYISGGPGAILLGLKPSMAYVKVNPYRIPYINLQSPALYYKDTIYTLHGNTQEKKALGF
ncbi:hypothetical protein V6N12_011252 [Hibiscus sabdariffa]|uniref:Uncharacterized protein n=1 Tax=Hibiscus sabdariffa TaxID=183260 RepID=A0ABR2EMG9_9ROSI